MKMERTACERSERTDGVNRTRKRVTKEELLHIDPRRRLRMMIYAERAADRQPLFNPLPTLR